MLLEVRDLTVKYDQIAALKGISLQVEEGKLTTLLGSNGAGKSTLLKTVSGALKPAAGEILYMGNNIAKLTSHDIVKKGIVQCPEGRKVFPRQTVYENLKMGAFVRKDREINEDIEKYYQQFPILRERRNQKAGLLSGGEQQMLAPIVVQEVFKMIRAIKESGTTILLIEQNAKQALKVADYGYIMEVGYITIGDDAKALLKSETVQKAYLGGA